MGYAPPPEVQKLGTTLHTEAKEVSTRRPNIVLRRTCTPAAFPFKFQAILKSITVFAIICALAPGCDGPRTGSNLTPIMKDPAELHRQLEFLIQIENCSYQRGIHAYRGGFVPGPNAIFLKGYATLSPLGIERLRTEYQWAPARASEIAGLKMLAGSPPLSGSPLESPQLVDSLMQVSRGFMFGTILLVPETRRVYFYVVKD